MKQILFTLLLGIVYSCSNDSFTHDEFEQDTFDSSNQLPFNTKRDSIQTRNTCYDCLPMVTAYYDLYFNKAVLAWSGFVENEINHPITMLYEINGSSNSQSIRNQNGEIRINVYSDKCLITWKISCNNYHCASCKKSGSVYKKASGEVITGAITECYKEYPSYSIEKVANSSNTYDLISNIDQYTLNNTDKYMTVDQARTYEVDSYSHQETGYFGVSLDMSKAPSRIRFYLSPKDMNKNYRIRFSSSKCINNINHFLYTSFYFDGLGSQLTTNLNLVKNHQ